MGEIVSAGNLLLVLSGIVVILVGLLFLRYPEKIGYFTAKGTKKMYNVDYRFITRNQGYSRSVRPTGWVFVGFGLFFVLCGALVPPEWM